MKVKAGSGAWTYRMEYTIVQSNEEKISLQCIRRGLIELSTMSNGSTLYERQLQRVLNVYVAYFNQARPYQGVQQQIPESYGSSRSTSQEGTKVVAVPIVAGLHHDYRKVA